MSDQPTKSGLYVSGALHGALLAFILFNFTAAPKFDDASESFPVDTITQTQFNEIMKGERDAKPVKDPPPDPPTRQTAAAEPPAPPTPPAPPPELKTADEPPPPEPPKAAPPPPPKPAPPSPAPPPKLTADDAPAPPVRPKEPTPEKSEKAEKTEKFKPDQLAKLLEKVKPDDPSKPQKPYDPNAIAKLIGQTKATNDPATPGVAPAQGLPNQHAQRMSPSQSAGLDAWLTEAYLNCWTPPPTMPEGDRYVAEIRVAFNADGTLSGQPSLVNPPTDPAWRAHAESALRAVLKCNPLHIPPQYLPYFEQWRTKTVHFDPESALG